MVARTTQPTAEPPRKRPRLDSKKPSRKFTSVEEIRAGLRTQNHDGFTETLTALRNQLSIKPGEDGISPQDERLLLAQHWMESAPGAHDIFEIWDNTTQRQTPVLALIVSILSSLLTLLSSHYTFHTLGQPIIKTLLTPPYIRRLNSYLGGSHSELILTTLKLYNGISAFAGGRERNAVLDAFGWEIKSLPKILNMRRRTKVEEVTDPLAKPDIRTLYVLLLLSFIDTDSSTQTKTTFLEQHRDALLSIFKGLVQDSYPVARKILEVCWSGIWSDQKIKRTVKIGLFNEATISHITKLYDRTVSEDDEAEHIPADLVHHFLLAICTRPGLGVCFKDRGWYPREVDGDDRIGKYDEEEHAKKGGKIYNKILSNVLKTLKVNEDLRQQELALKILSACPELVAGYWSGAALTLEPRLSSKWIANISLFGSIISLPIPSDSFHLPGSTLYQPTPPPLNSIMENILPSVNTKAHLSKGLLSSSGLVQHCTALALAKCLDKYEQVLTLFSQIETLLEESEADGQWCKRRRDIEREVRRRVPEFQVIVAFSQQKSGEGTSSAGATAVLPNPTKAALLSESALRLLWMYHRCLPLVVAEARFDVGKLLQNFSVEAQTAKVNTDSDKPDESPDAAVRLHMVRQLHVLRLLKDSDQFAWSGKMGSSSQSYLAVLLKAYTASKHPATQNALAGLLDHVLSESIMFQEDPDEPHLWLASLPTTRRAPGADSPDGAPLTDEADGIIALLDDCVQRCMKTPYRYIEELYSLSNSDDQNPTEGLAERLDVYPSPLLMTMLEQLDVKLGKKILSPSDVLALASFLRKLVYRLTTKQQGLLFLQCVMTKIDAILHPSRLFPQYPIITAAIRREVSLLQICLEGPQASSAESNRPSQAVQDFLHEVEKLSIPASKDQHALVACEFVDWVRLVDHPLGHSELRRVSDVLVAFHPPMITDLAENVDPNQGSLWYGLDIVSSFAERQKYLRFDSLFLHSREAQVTDGASRDILVEAAFGGVSTLVSIKRAVSLIAHRLVNSRAQDTLTRGMLLLLASVMKRASTELSAADIAALKEAIFVRSEVMRIYLTSESISNPVREGLDNLVKVSLDSTSQRDRTLVADTTAYWLDALKRSLTGVLIETVLVVTWIPYFQPTDLLDVLDILAQTISSSDTSMLLVLETVLHSLQTLVVADSSSELPSNLGRRLPQLLSLWEVMPDLTLLEEIIAVAVVASLPAYCDGSRLGGAIFEETTMNSIITRSNLRWSQHLDSLPDDLPLRPFLDKTTWTTSTIQILSGLLYQRLIPKDSFISWLETDDPTHHPIEQLAPVLYAFLDASSCEGGKTEQPKVDVWSNQVSRLLEAVTAEHLSPELRSTSGSCVTLIVSLNPSGLPQFLANIAQTVQALPVTSLTVDVLTVGLRLHSIFPLDTAPLLTALADHGMQWAVRRFAEEDGSFKAIVEELTRLIQVASNVKPHLVETVIGVVIQNRLSEVSALKLITSLLSAVQLKPSVINRFLQSIVQHPQIFKLCGSTGSNAHASRDAIINTLYVLFNLHPNNTCQATHVEPLVRIYGGTLSVSDGQILTIFQLFETQRKTSIAPLLCRWSSSPGLPSATSLDAIQSLDAIVVLRTCLNFPSWRRLEHSLTEQATSHDAQLYDPIFLILLFSQTLAENPPSSAFAWVELFRTNVVSLLIKAMSSKDDGIRDAALCQLTGLWQYLVDADLQEKPHVIHILTLLKDVLPAPSDEPPKRLPSYTTLILLHALRGIFYPSNFIYPITARFLLQRPELDTTDVPMLYNMLYSSTDDWKKERGWIIRFLSDGMMSTEDWRVLKRRHTWDLLASLFQSSEGDRALRHGVFEVLANLTCNAQATTSLVLKSGLLAWIEMQLVTSKEIESVEWVKILDNIMTVGNSDKLELSTNSEWRNGIYRCLSILLHFDRTSNTSGVFPFAVAALLRLSLLKGPPISDLSSLVDRALGYLTQMETIVIIPPTGTRIHTSKKDVPVGPFRAHDIHEPHADDDRLQMWGSAVEALWRVTMTLDNKPSAWDALTTRLLIWRAIVGAEGSAPGEWARKQVVHSIAV